MNPHSGCATHSVSMGYFEGRLRAHLAHLRICCGQVMAIIAVTPSSLVPAHPPGGVEDWDDQNDTAN